MDDPLEVAGGLLKPCNHLLMMHFQPEFDPALGVTKTVKDKSGRQTRVTHFDLDKVTARLGAIASRPTRFSAIVMRKPGLDCVALVFYSGKMSVMGKRRYSEFQDCARFYISKLAAALGVPRLKLSRKVELMNIVATWKRPEYRLALGKLMGARGVQYEPEQMNKVVWRPWEDSSITINLYFSGGVVVTGPTSLKEMRRTARFLERELPALMCLKE